MNRLTAFLAILLCTLAMGATPPQSISLDISETSRSFKIQTAEGTTPLFRCVLKNAGAAYTATGWTGTLYLSPTWTGATVIAIPSTSTSSTAVDFQLTAAQTGTPGIYTASFVLTDGTATVEWQRGTVDIRDNPGTDGATAEELGQTINWGNFTFSNTANAGPYRVGTNVTFSTNGDGSVNINSKVVGTAAAGRVLYGDAGGLWQALGAGSAGQVLQSNGAAAPSWAAAGGVADGDKGDLTISGSGTVWTIDSGAVTVGKIGTGAVSAAKLADADFGDWSVASGVATIDSGAITVGKIGSGAVSAIKLADADFGDWTVASGVATIDASAVTLAKMANLAQDTVIGRASGAGTGAPVALTAAQLATIVSGANVFLPLAGGTMSGAINFNNTAATNLNKTAYVNGAAVGYLHIDGTEALKYYSTTGGTDLNVIIGNASGLVDYSLISTTGADEGEHLVFSGGVWGASASGAALTSLTAANLTGNIPADSFGELVIDWSDRDMHLHTTAQVGWSLYEVDTGTRTFSGDAAKSANTSEQAFTFRTGTRSVPLGFTAFKTTGALTIDWIADSTTVADIRGITVYGYNPITGSKTTLYTDATTRNVGTINVPETISINRSAFASTTVPTHILIEIDGAIEDSMSMAILHIEIRSE